MTTSIKKSTEKRGVTRVIMETFGNYRKHIVLLALLGFFSALLDGIGISAVVPLLSFLLGGSEALPGDFITSAIQYVFELVGIPFQFRYLFFFIISLFVLRAGALVIFTYIRAYIAADFMKKEMYGLLAATLRSRWGFLLEQKAGHLQNTIYWDIKRTQGLLEVIAQAVQSWTGFLVYFVVSLMLSPSITLVTVFVGGILLLFLRPLVAKTKDIGEATSTAEKDFSHLMVEHLGGLKTVKAAGVERAVLGSGDRLLTTLQTLFRRNAVVHAMGTILIQPASLIFILIIFAFSYLTGTLNLPVFVAILYLIQKIFLYLQSGQATFHAIYETAPFAENISRYKEKVRMSKEERESGTGKFSFNHTLDFKDVSLSYDGNVSVLKSVSLSIPKGGIVGLVGSSGAGKTSIADLILRLFVPSAGTIELDGENVASINLEAWRSNIGYVPQDSFLINDSIEENVRFYRPEITQKDVIEALKKANVYDVVESLPNGIASTIGDRGSTLSGGQRQRLTLARALAGKPAILVLDEATSALDTESERLIQETILSLKGQVSVLIIAHRLSTVMRSDTLFVLDKGRVVESGSPEALLHDKDSYFFRMYQL